MAAAPQTRGEQDQDSPSATCNLDVYVLFDGGLAPAPQSSALRSGSSSGRAANLPRITVVSRREDNEAGAQPLAVPVAVRATEAQDVNHNDGATDQPARRAVSAEEPFGGGLCRQLAAMYTDVGMTTVERVRWLCGCMILAYVLASLALFARPLYLVPLLGLFTGAVGLCACRRPHERRYLSYVFSFLALNFAQMALLIWVLFATLTSELTTVICQSVCLGIEVKTILIVVLVLSVLLLHYRVHQITRHYVREFRMIEQLAIRGRRPQYSVGDAASFMVASSTLATEVSRASSTASRSSVVAVAINHDTYEPPRVHPAAYSTADQSRPAVTRL